jgi:hypothetical protein
MELAMNAAHQDQVVEPPEGAEPWRQRLHAHAVLAYGDHILTLQPHPEIAAGFMSYLLRLRGTHLSPAELEAAIAELDMPNDARPWSPTGSPRSCAERPRQTRHGATLETAAA